MREPRVSDETLAAIIDSGLQVFDGFGVNVVALDLRDARAELAALREERAALVPVVRAAVKARAVLMWQPGTNACDEPNAAQDEINEMLDALNAFPDSLRAKYSPDAFIDDGATTPEGYEDEGFA